MIIKEVMAKDVVTIRKDQTVTDALRIMKKHKISRIPAISSKDNNKLVGIVTEKDIATKISSSKYENIPLTHIRISTIMTQDVITAEPDDSVLKVLKLMVDEHIGGIPILDGDDIVGIVTKTDFIKECTGEPYTETQVKEIMTNRVITIEPDQRVVHARRLMIDNDIGRLVVINSGVIMGIITAKDLAKSVIEFKKRVPEKYQESQIRNIFVQEIMSQTIETAKRTDSIADVAKIMVEKEFSGMPISDNNNKVYGIVSKFDLLKFIYNNDRKRNNY